MPYFEIFIPERNSAAFREQVDKLEGAVYEKRAIAEDARGEWDRQCSIAQQLIATSVEEEDLNIVLKIREGARLVLKQSLRNRGVLVSGLYLDDIYDKLMDVFTDSVIGNLPVQMFVNHSAQGLIMKRDFNEGCLSPAVVITAMEYRGIVDGIPKDLGQIRHLYGIAPRPLSYGNGNTILVHPAIRPLVRLL